MKQLIIFITLTVIFIGAGWLSFSKGRSSTPIKTLSPSITPIQSDSSSKSKISGMVVPHHDLVKKYREELFQEVKKSIAEPKTIILISPNHYGSGEELVQTTLQTWDTSKGIIEPNKHIINKLIENDVVSEEPKSFINEHGIKLILGDIKDSFPNSQVIPLIFKTKTPKDEILKVHNLLKENCDNCLMIASVDFSHYQPALLANLHDDLTERALKNLDTSLLLSKAEVDSPESLALLVEWAESHATTRFVVKNHTNSGELANNPDTETTTHFFGWYETGELALAENSVSFIIGGDMMFGRMIAHSYLGDGLSKVLDQLGNRVFWGTDAGIINLEGPISETPVPDTTNPNNLRFNFPPETIKALQDIKVSAVSLANNHTADNGTPGIETTRRLLKEAKIQPLGGPNASDTTEIVTIQGNNLTLSVIGVNAVFSKPDIKPFIKQLKEKQNNRILVFPHWGSEYVYKHSPTQEQLAHDWIDAGADIVIGAHPHVIQDTELYKGKPIIYSIGNFVFDQTFSSETQQGLFIAGQFKDNRLELFALPHKSTKYKPALLRGNEKITILNKLYEPFKQLKEASPAGELLVFPK